MVSWRIRLDATEDFAVRAFSADFDKPISKTIGILVEEYLQELSAQAVAEVLDDDAE